MRAYVKILCEIINKELDKNKKFNLIKLENFNKPEIYFEVCEKIKNILSEKNVKFNAKLAKEKYNMWNKIYTYNKSLDSMKKNGWIEESENLTMWRNEPFKDNEYKAVVILMGTESVEDKGGLEEFFGISQESVERYIGNKYHILLRELGFNYSNDEYEQFNYIIDAIFSYVPKNILKLSDILQEFDNNTQFLVLIHDIVENMYENWTIPNIYTITKNDLKRGVFKKRVNSAYKFSRRIGLEYSSSKKIEDVKKKLNIYLNKYNYEINKQINEKFPGYTTYEEFSEDLINYLKGVNLEKVKDKVLKVDFDVIAEILKIKEGNGTGAGNDKTKIIKGEPFKALFLPVIFEYSKLNDEEKESVVEIEINVESIKLAGTKANDEYKEELKNKWREVCLFIGGIERLVDNLYLTNNYGDDIKISIISEMNKGQSKEKIDTFNIKNMNELINSGILGSGSNIETKSKIFLNYKIKMLNEKERNKKYNWQFYDNDIWLNTLKMFNDNKFIALLNKKRVLPIAYGKSVDEMLDCLSESEFFYLIKNKSVEYYDILDEVSNEDDVYVLASELAEQFVKSMSRINTNGFFDSLFQYEYIPEYLNKYSNFCNGIKEKIQKGNSSNNANILSKSFLLLNTKALTDKSIIGAIVPPYHPVMLERILDRYRYLSNGFKEIFEEIKNQHELNIKNIISRFDRFDQLSTVTNSVEFLIGKNNNYIGDNSTLGYYTLFGEANNDYCGSNYFQYSFDEEDEVIGNEQTPVSQNISKIIKDFIKTYPSKIDGIRLAFYEPKEYKDIILGLNKALKELSKSNEIKLKVTIYTSDYRCKGANYFRYWIENNFDEDSGVIIEPKIKYFNIRENKENIRQYIEKKIEISDILFIDNIMSYKEIIEEYSSNSICIDNIETSKYPTVYLPIISNQEKVRKNLLSQTQFSCANDFSQFMIFVNNKIAKEGDYKIIKATELKQVTEELLEIINERSSWTVVMDENIDKNILKLTGNNIIAFSTGKGYFGELNLSISSKDSYLKDLKRFLARRLKLKFNTWNNDEIRSATEKCIEYASEMDGAEILKAINPADESINEYLAFLLTSKILEKNSTEVFLLRKLVSVDSHSHLFDEQIEVEQYRSLNRPDFMLFEIENKHWDEEELIINITLIECKLANENYEHVSKAKQQLISGFNRINNIWGKEKTSVQDRYWYNQLYRLLAYNNENVSTELINKLNDTLYNINNGNFMINIKNKIFTYWMDLDINGYTNEELYEEENVEIEHKSFDRRSIKGLLIKDNFKYYDRCELNEFNGYEDLKVDDTIIKKDTNFDENKDINYNNIDINKNEESDFNDKKNESDNSKVLMNEYNSTKIEMIDLFNESEEEEIDEEEEKRIEVRKSRLKNELELRKVNVIIDGHTTGPDIVRISVSLGIGVDYDKINKFSKDMKLWLAINEEPNIFIEDGLVKIDIPRKKRQTISFKYAIRETLKDERLLSNYKEKLYILLGLDILGKPKMIDLSDSNSPHLLVAGQTGSGKSVLLASMLTSMMVYYTPNEVELQLIDPKKVELTVFEESEYCNLPTATEPHEAVTMLENAVDEMEKRYTLFKKNKVQNLTKYNQKVCETERMKRILIVVDEFGDLMEAEKEFVKSFERALKRLSSKARAAGIHLIICTQSPRADIITTTIRNNLPARVGLKVADSNASSLILDGSGCEKLLGKGDMILKTAESSTGVRCKSPFIDQDEIEKLNEYYMNKEYK